jgi:hypothetical protein
MMLKRALIGAGIVFGLLLFGFGLFVILLINPEWRMPSQTGHGGISLRTVAGCSESLKWDQPSRVESVAKTDNTLRVVVLANATCGAVFPVNPSANIKNSDIELSWDWWHDPIGMSAKCECTRHLEFTMPGIGGATPTVTIAARKQRMY